MSFRVKLRSPRGRVFLRDGSTLDSPVIQLSADEFAVFENKPRHEDPELIVEEIEAQAPPVEAPKRKRGRPKKAKAEAVQ